MPERHRRRARRASPLQRLMLLGAALLLAAAAGLLIRYLIDARSTRSLQQELRADYALELAAQPQASESPAALPQAGGAPAEADLSPSGEDAAKAPGAAGEGANGPFSQAPVPAMPASGVPTPFPLPAAGAAMRPEFVSFYGKNKDLVGWLSADAVSEIDFPIVQRDNSFYESHDFYGRKNAAGTVFMDAANSILPQDQNLILHGHNMKNGTMFGKLFHLMNREALLSRPFFRFSTLYDAQVYVPYAVSLVSIDPASPRYVPLIAPGFSGSAERQGYADALRGFSALELPVDIGPNDRMLTLVTCHGDEDSERLVIGLRALRPDETEEGMKARLEAGTRTR